MGEARSVATEQQRELMVEALAARASAYGEFFERLGTHYFWTHFYLGETRANRPFVHYPQERWFAPTADGAWPKEMLNPELHAFYNPEGSINGEVLVDLNSGNVERGICTLPYRRLRDDALRLVRLELPSSLFSLEITNCQVGVRGSL